MSTSTASQTITGLLVLGGQSSRMGSDKAFLPYPLPGTSSEPLWRHLARILLAVCPEGIVVSHNAKQADQLKDDKKVLGDLEGKVAFVQDVYEEMGPAAGLISAHEAYGGKKTFFAVAVDFPFVTEKTLRFLVDKYKAEVTTYLHPIDMHPEPLLSIWSPVALERLKKNATTETDGRKRTGPCYTVKQMWKESGEELGVLPLDELELRNTNTPEEWQKAVDELRQRC